MLEDGDIFPLRVTSAGVRRKEVNMINERKVQLEIMYLNTDRDNKIRESRRKWLKGIF